MEPVELLADPTRLEEIVINLLNNAAKFTEPGGKIQVTAEREGGEAVIHVRDTGIGISAEMLPRIFKLFDQADRSLDRSQGGLGIGLTLVKQLAEMHGGTVQASSEGVGKGSQFEVRLPALPPVKRPQEEPPVEKVVPNGQSLKILVVDDNMDAAETLSHLLDLWGHSVITAYDGMTALEEAEAFHPDYVLLDIGLPGMDGYQVAERLRQRKEFEGTRLVAVSGYGLGENRRRSEEAGFDHHLTKPVDPDVLLGLLQTS
jgi:CheY-like chemotaxis protein